MLIVVITGSKLLLNVNVGKYIEMAVLLSNYCVVYLKWTYIITVNLYKHIFRIVVLFLLFG